jgi:hypothetical protein
MDSHSQVRRAVRFGASQSDLVIHNLRTQALITQLQEKTFFDSVKSMEYDGLSMVCEIVYRRDHELPCSLRPWQDLS